MKYKLITGTFFIPFIALSVVTQLYMLIPVYSDLILFIKGASLNNVGLLTTLFGIFYAIGLIVWGSLSDQIGKERTLAIGLLLLATISFIIPFITNYYLLLISRTIQGFCAASFPPVAIAWITLNLSEPSKSKAVSIISCAFLLAGIVGQWFGTLMITNSLYRAMWVLMVIYILGSLLFFYNIPKKTYQESSSIEKASIFSIFRQLTRVLFSKKLFPIYLCSLVVLLSFVTLYSILPNSNIAAYITTLRNIGIVAMLFSLTASYIFRFIRPVYVLALSLFLMVTSLLIHYFYLNDQLNNIYLLFISHFIFIVSLAYSVPSMITCVATLSAIDERGIATSLYTCILFIGASLGAFFPIIFRSNILILLISISMLIVLVQLILFNKKIITRGS